MKNIRFGIGALATCMAFAQGGFNGPGRYEITNVKSGKVIDLDRNDQTTVIQFASRGTDNQSWDVQPAGNGFYYFRNGMNGNALTVVGTHNATPVQGEPYRGDPSQQWQLETGKDGNIIIVSSMGKVLDIPDGTSRDGARIRVYDRNGDSNQRFLFRRVAGGSMNRRYRYSGDRGEYGREGAGPAVITCASDDGRRHYCNADTSNGARLLRQISEAPCVQGQTWGFDDRGLWVDRGCRAEFDTAGATTPVRTLTCSSDDGGRHHCAADTRGGVRLSRQISGTACIQGQTWDIDGRGIWVDRGCRAEFETGGGSQFYPGDRRRR